MSLNESVRYLVEEGFEVIAYSDVNFFLKLLAIFGAIWLFNISLKTGGSIINFIFYIIAFFKWVILKIMKRDV